MSDSLRRTARWVGVSALSFGAAALGAATRSPGVLMVAIVGVAYAAAARSADPPEPELDLTRSVEPSEPEPGDSVRVTLSVTNEGEATLPDVRVVDGVPETLGVAGGSPRLGTALRPGETDALEYEVDARRGEHRFTPTKIVTRDWTGAIEREGEREVGSELVCTPDLPPLPSFPLREQATDYAGRVPTKTGGNGVEFHSTRQYRPGDPLARIDWARLARTGELTTVDFREERAAETVLVFDTRVEAYVADADDDSAVEHGIEAGGAVASALLEASNRVGVAAFGPRWEWVPPGLGRTHRARLRKALGTAEAFDPLPPAEEFLPVLAFRRLRERLPSDAQVVFVSPAVDDYARTVARRLEARGYAVTLLSPDVTDNATAGRALARLERRRRLTTTRAAGIRVVDWDPETSLSVALERANRGWRA